MEIMLHLVVLTRQVPKTDQRAEKGRLQEPTRSANMYVKTQSERNREGYQNGNKCTTQSNANIHSAATKGGQAGTKAGRQAGDWLVDSLTYLPANPVATVAGTPRQSSWLAAIPRSATWGLHLSASPSQ